MKKRILSVLLAMCLMIGLLPTVALAATSSLSTEVPTQNDAALASATVYFLNINTSIKFDHQGNMLGSVTSAEDTPGNLPPMDTYPVTVSGRTVSLTNVERNYDGIMIVAADINGINYVFGYLHMDSYTPDMGIFGANQITETGGVINFDHGGGGWNTFAPTVTVTANPAEGGTVTGARHRRIWPNAHPDGNAQFRLYVYKLDL